METADSSKQGLLYSPQSGTILDPLPEADFDRITRLAARICNSSIATIALLDDRRQWFKSAVGLDLPDISHAAVFCAHTLQGTGLFLVPDLRADARFAGNPLVIGKPRLRFYAGVPLISASGIVLGALAIMDCASRTLSEMQIETLETLAEQVVVLIKLRQQQHMLKNQTVEYERMTSTVLGQNRNLLQLAAHLANAGGWAVELAESRVVWSDRVCEIHDVAPGYSPTIMEAINFCVPGSQLLIQQAYDRCILSGTPFDEELQIITAKRRRVWVRSIGQAVRDAVGAIIRVQGALQDITEKKQAEQKLQQLANKLTITLESIGEAYFTLDRRWRFTYLNTTAEELLQRQSSDLHGKTVWKEFKAIIGTAFDRECRRAVRDNCTVVFEEFYPPLNLWLEVRAYPSTEGLAIYFRNMSKRRQAYEAIRESEERFKSVANATTDAIWDWDIKADTIWWSEGMQTLFGFPPEEIEPGSESWASRIHPEDKIRVLQGIHAVIDGQDGNWSDEYRFLRKNGSYSYVLDRGFVLRDSEKRAVRMVGGMTDLTARKQAELDLAHLNRALRMRSACNELLIRTEDETALLAGICRLALDIGGYRMAWVGYAEDDEHRSISIVAQAGDREDAAYVAALRLSWSDSKLDGWGQGSAGRTIRSGMPLAIEDITKSASFPPWQVTARQRGYRGVIYLPLRNKDRTFGLMALYSRGTLTASTDEIKLLQELADELSFGINNIRSQDERRRMQSAVLKVAIGVSASTGTEFFEHLARNMAEAVGAQAGFVTRLLPGKPLSVRTIAAVVDGVLINNCDYVIEGTPCEFLLEHGQCVVPAAVAQRFTGTSPLSAVGAEAYVGRRLDNSLGQPVGLLFVLFCEPLTRTDFVTSTLQIFAARAAGELERQEADARIRNQASLLDKAQDAIVVRGIDHRVTFWNKGAERLYGWTVEEAVGRSVKDLFYDDSDAFLDATGKVLEVGDWSGEISQRCKDGKTVTVEGRWTLVKDDNGAPQSILTINTDITQRKAAEQKIQHLAFYDPLTRLPNRLLLLERLQHAMTMSARTRHTGALLFIDLDNFKTLNDTLGHDKGDLLLQQVAIRLASCVRETDTVARLGGDEFVVMLENLGDNQNEAAARAKTIGEKILTAFNQPYQLADYEYHSTPSIGATLFNNEVGKMDELLKRADLAMYQAKAAGRNALRFFDPEMQAVVTARASLEKDLRRALHDNQFLMHYQPQVAGDGRIIGAEALVRWQHPQRGLISPAEFIPLAEETGLILPLGQWVLQTACIQLVAWAAAPETVRLTLAVNVSARQFRRPDFVEQLLTMLDETGADPEKLKLELTESLLLDNVEDTIAKMTVLKTKGVGFSLDDFGTGYSSLYYLKRLPLDQLKIDQSFVRDVLTDPNDATIARTIVALGQSLGLEVIAEGVETEAQREFLAHHNCHAYQGYLFSRPLPAEQFHQFMRRNTQL